MIDKAKVKLQQEMDKHQDNLYVHEIGEYLKKFISMHPGQASKILAEGKSILGSLDYMSQVASKKRIKNYAVLTYQEGYAAVLSYYGINLSVGLIDQPTLAVKEVKQTAEFNVTLEELIV